MTDAMQALLPKSLDPYAPLFVGALTALIILTIGWIISKWARSIVIKLCKKRHFDEALGRFLAAILQYTILAAAVIAALGKVGVESTSLVAILGAAGLAVGFALQGSLGNFASGIMMLIFRPIDIGQRVQVSGISGEVKEIGLFATTMTTRDNETLIIPNSKITDDNIINYSKRGTIRANIEIGVAYGVDISRAIEVIQQACKESDKVLDDPAPDVVFVGFGASSLDLKARPWCLPDDYPAMCHQVRVSIYNALNNANIEIPFNQIVVHQASNA